MKKSRRKTRPLLILISEVLEVRQMLTTTFSTVASLNRTTRTLTITGTEDADRVAIQQNDARKTLSVTTGHGNSPDVTQQFPSQLVDRIMIQLSGGDDKFQYATVSNIRYRKSIGLSLGSGDDDAFVRWAEDGGRALADLNFNVTGDAGSDSVGVRIGRLRSRVTTLMSVDLGDGDDGFVAQVMNPDRARAKLTVNALGGAGNDELQYLASGTIGRRAAVNVSLDGQAGNDSFEVQNLGRIDGDLTQILTGGDGDDLISAAAIDATGAGRYTVTSNGDAGDDTLLMDIRPAKGQTLSVKSTVDGGAGDNQAISANPTVLRNVEVVTPVTPQNRPITAGTFDPVLPTSVLRDSGRTIEYWTRGQSAPDAPVVVLVSGAGGDIDNWLPMASMLNGLGQVISVNKPGFGRTSSVTSSDQTYSEAVVEDIRTVVEKLVPGRQVILVGHSLGGPYSNLYARSYPSEVAGVVFVDSTAQNRVDPNEVEAEFGSPVYRVYPIGVQQEQASIADSINAPLEASEFPKIPVIALSQDLPPEILADAQHLAGLGSPGRLQVVKDAGHYLQSDQPAVVAAAIREMVQKTQISGILADAVTKYGIPGITASVVAGNQVLTGAAGVRAAGAAPKVQVEDRFGMGSTTKAMTATLAGVLVDRGTLRWNSTISELFPELTSTMRPEYRNVTLEQLLQHRGRIVADEDASEALGELVASYNGSAKQARQVLVPEILKEKPAVAVGEYSYSNGGYAVAAAMMERATRVDYETLMNCYIFGPLRMRSATFNPKASDPANPKQPIGHLPDGTPAPGDKAPLAYLGKFLRPAGAELRMNVADWSKFIRIHLGQTVNGVRLVRPETLSRLHQAVELMDAPAGVGYSMGWVVASAEAAGLDSSYGQVLNHNGSDGVWLSEVVALPDVDFSIQILANATLDKQGNDLGATAFTEIKQRLLQRFAPKPVLPGAGELLRTKLADIRNETNIPAIAGGVIVDGKLVGQAAVGNRKAGTSDNISTSDVFHLGSNGKSMTATLAAILVQIRTVRWGTTIEQAFPELRGKIKAAYAKVTLEELLNHRGGFGDVETEAANSKLEQFQNAAVSATAGRAAYLRDWMTTETPANARGQFRYSNVGYTVAGAMLERLAGESFETLMPHYVFNPLEMGSAGFGTPWAGGRMNQPVGHDENGKPIADPLPRGIDLLSPSGGIFMNMADWSKYLQVHLGQRVNGIQLLTPASLKKIHTSDTRSITDESGTYRYGFGWRTAETPLGEALGHEGAFGGFYSRVGIIPSRNIAIFCATNELSENAAIANKAFTEAVIEILQKS